MRFEPVLHHPWPSFLLLSACWLALCGGTSAGDGEERYFEENGILYREQRLVERRPVAQWEWEERQEVSYREEFTTTFREEQRVTRVAVVVASSDGSPPITRWENRTQIVRSPVVVRELVPETRVARVPVRRLGFVAEERIARVALGPAPATATASRPVNTMSPSGFNPALGR